MGMCVVRSGVRGLVLTALILASSGVGVAQAEPLGSIDTVAKQAIVLDDRSGMVLMEKNADELMAPSSMSKLMTAYMVFGKLKDHSWSMDDELPVSETAWKKHFKSGGSLMFLDVFSRAKVGDLLRGVIIQSGNDACSVLAEAYAGNEEAFAELATRQARKMGMNNTTLRNASGMPDPEHLTTARDLSILAQRLIHDYPDYLPLYSEKDFTYNKIKQGNRNPLLYSVPGADGLKTGHTAAGGYGLVGTVKRGDRRVILVINGIKSQKERSEESARLVEWAFREFDAYPLYAAGAPVVETDVWMGESKTVNLVTDQLVEMTLPRNLRKDLKVTVTYDSPVAAPIAQGQVLGKLVVTLPQQAPREYPLVAATAVPELSGVGRFMVVLNKLSGGLLGQ